MKIELDFDTGLITTTTFGGCSETIETWESEAEVRKALNAMVVEMMARRREYVAACAERRELEALEARKKVQKLWTDLEERSLNR